MVHDHAAAEERIHRHLAQIKSSTVGAHRILSAMGGSERRKPSPRDILIKALAARVIAYPLKRDAAEMAKTLYGERIAKAVAEPDTIFKATAPARTDNLEWAGALAGGETVAALPLLSPNSTYATLHARGLNLEFGPGAAAFRLPSRTNPGTELAGGFVGEGDAIPVKKLTLTSGTVVPHKLGVISTFTSEIAKRSLPNIEALLRDAIAFDTQVALDAVLLSDTAATAASPGGILVGVTPIAPTAGGGIVALSGDLSKLAEAIPYSTDLVYLLPLAEYQRALILAPALAGSFVIAPALPAKRIVAVDSSDFASVENAPEFDISSEAAIHEEDTAPLPLATGTAGAGAITAAPVRELYQTDVLGLRMLCEITWAMRRANRVQTITGITW
ncbi:phage major capsid protein [Ensifer adhaerens]|uniref:phage major capsid family protein n=1 Tax=Ensifer adhaerens TaxID=106592 RepID=UPI0015C317CE|nr:phage major capsid protein [Ensifer adhaerens]